MTKLREHIDGFTRYRLAISGLRASTVKTYSNSVIEFFNWFEMEQLKIPATVSTTVADVTRKAVVLYLEHLFHNPQNKSAATRNKKLIAIRNFYNYLDDEGVVEKNITKGIPNAKYSPDKTHEFTREEILKIFKAINPETTMGQRDIVIFILAAFGGLRVGEITHLNMSDITDAERGVGVIVHVGNKEFTPKRGSYRKVDIWKAPADKIRHWIAIRRPHGVVPKNAPLLISYSRGDHPRPDKRLTSVAVSHLVKKYAAGAKIINPESRMHMFRAAHASSLRYIEGEDIFSAAKRLGHKDIKTTSLYVQEWDRIKKKDRRPSLAAYWHKFKHLWDEEESEEETPI